MGMPNSLGNSAWGRQIPCSVGDTKSTEGVPKSLGDLARGCRIPYDTGRLGAGLTAGAQPIPMTWLRHCLGPLGGETDSSIVSLPKSPLGMIGVCGCFLTVSIRLCPLEYRASHLSVSDGHSLSSAFPWSPYPSHGILQGSSNWGSGECWLGEQWSEDFFPSTAEQVRGYTRALVLLCTWGERVEGRLICSADV